jgi:hypothetical protein
VLAVCQIIKASEYACTLIEIGGGGVGGKRSDWLKVENKREGENGLILHQLDRCTFRNRHV